MNHRNLLRLFPLAAVILMAAVSCGDDDADDFILKPSGNTPTPSEPSTPSASSAQAAGLEIPRLKDGNIFVQHDVEYQGRQLMNYCLEYDPQARHSRWVAFRFDPITRQKNVGRSSEPFIDDPLLIPSGFSIGYNGFGSNYYDLNNQLQKLPAKQFDRGHLCASADRYLSREANEQTFYMSNMSPQMSNFNSPYWSSFENYVQSRGRDAAFADTLYVVKGGTIESGQILGHIQRPNGASVTVPRYYFMALLKCKNQTYSAIAFWMEHKDYGTAELTTQQISRQAISIDELEEKTGIDFFCNLPDNIEQTVEALLMPAAWGL